MRRRSGLVSHRYPGTRPLVLVSLERLCFNDVVMVVTRSGRAAYLRPCDMLCFGCCLLLSFQVDKGKVSGQRLQIKSHVTSVSGTIEGFEGEMRTSQSKTSGFDTAHVIKVFRWSRSND